MAEIQRGAAVSEMGERKSRVDAERLLAVGQGAIGFSADVPKIGVVDESRRVARIDLDRLIEIRLSLAEIALEREGKAALRIGGGKLSTTGGAGSDDGRTTGDPIVGAGVGSAALRFHVAGLGQNN
ncbi:MAG TPA: hypothetical protein VII24_07800 [Pseudolabrys sp.]